MTRYLLLILALAATVLTTPAVVTANQAVPTRDTFLATKWRLMEPAVSILPLDGFPITFRPDGTVVTRNLGRITRWSLDGDELLLSDDERIRVMRLKWLPGHGVFRDCRIPSKIPLYVFPQSMKDPLSIGCDDVPAAVLKLQIALDKAAYQPGERIVATATLTNIGNAPITVRRSVDETGRSDGFRVELTKDSVNALQSAPSPAPGSPTVAESLSPGSTNSRQLVLNRLLGSLKPGKYRLTIIYSATYAHVQIEIGSEPITLEIISQAAPLSHSNRQRGLGRHRRLVGRSGSRAENGPRRNALAREQGRKPSVSAGVLALPVVNHSTASRHFGERSDDGFGNQGCKGSMHGR